MSSSNCCFLTCIQISQETDQVVWYFHLLKNFPQIDKQIKKKKTPYPFKCPSLLCCCLNNSEIVSSSREARHLRSRCWSVGLVPSEAIKQVLPHSAPWLLVFCCWSLGFLGLQTLNHRPPLPSSSSGILTVCTSIPSQAWKNSWTIAQKSLLSKIAQWGLPWWSSG